MNRHKVEPYSLFSEYDLYLLRAGVHYRLYQKLGAHAVVHDGRKGVYFSVWAPGATYLSVTGDFNNWHTSAHPLIRRPDDSGIWEGFIPEVAQGAIYKYFIRGDNGWEGYKGDPYAVCWQAPPETASIVWCLDYDWQDRDWMAHRAERNALTSPISVYELHLGSWRKPREEELAFYTYDEIADRLIPYVQEMGFTHVEFMPVMEHPYYPSWGYQIHGFFAATSRYGEPQGLMRLVDRLHQAGIGVFLDWVPSHFPADMHGLYRFDGTALYEHADPREGFHPEWSSYIFNYGRFEVRSFLISNALFWMDYFHADGLRVDAIASMIFRDYARKDGEWVPNRYGGNENLEAIAFLKDLNTEVYRSFPGVQMIAEDSTAYPGVSRPIYDGGLGFGLKWMMGWMNDTLKYFRNDPIYRKFHHQQITFSIVYAWSENFMLPLSHDEVVHGKASLLLKMPGDDWQKFANLRVLLGYMYTHPGKKLLFMGAELAQLREWSHARSLDWDLLQHISHAGVHTWVKTLNMLYRTQPALYRMDHDEKGFEWLVVGDFQQSVLAFLRKSEDPDETVLVIHNLTPVPRAGYRTGISVMDSWYLLANSDESSCWGSGWQVRPELIAEAAPANGRPYSLEVDLPPLATLVYRVSRDVRRKSAGKKKRS